MMQNYFNSIETRKTGLRWATSLIKKVRDTSWDMWDHRNRLLNDGDGDEDLLGITSLHEEMTTIYYAPRTHLMPRDNHALFSHPLVDLLSQTLQMKQA